MDELRNKNWLKCLKCKGRLAKVEIRNGHTTIEVAVFGFLAWLERAEIVCPHCGEVRRFTSAPVERGKKQPADVTFITSPLAVNTNQSIVNINQLT